MLSILAGGFCCLLASTATTTGAHARQRIFEELERQRLEADLKRYHEVVTGYQNGDEESVGRILNWDPKGGGELHPFARMWYATVSSVLRTVVLCPTAEGLTLERVAAAHTAGSHRDGMRPVPLAYRSAPRR